MLGVHPQTLAVPLPPHESLPEQLPHGMLPPQPSGMEPQFLPCAAHVVGVHVQTLLLHVSLPPHEPHPMEPPHPSLMEPQFLPCALQLVGLHAQT